jgi:hypothetical protein
MGKTSLKIRLKVLLLILLSLCITTCSVKLHYYDKEQAVAERGVADFHRFYNAENFEGMYGLFDENVRKSGNKDTYLDAMKQTYKRWGKVQSTKSDWAKVFPSGAAEVRISYNTRYEKGDGIEWFIWKVDDNGARLIQYQNFPANDQSMSGK